MMRRCRCFLGVARIQSHSQWGVHGKVHQMKQWTPKCPVRVMPMPKVYIAIVIKEQLFLFQVDKHCNNIIYTWVCIDCKSELKWVNLTSMEMRQLTYNWYPHSWQNSHSWYNLHNLSSTNVAYMGEDIEKRKVIFIVLYKKRNTRQGNRTRHLQRRLVSGH